VLHCHARFAAASHAYLELATRIEETIELQQQSSSLIVDITALCALDSHFSFFRLVLRERLECIVSIVSKRCNSKRNYRHEHKGEERNCKKRENEHVLVKEVLEELQVASLQGRLA
jgi:hypothetical protein